MAEQTNKAQKGLPLPRVTVGRRETRSIGDLRMRCVYLVKGHIAAFLRWLGWAS